MLKNKLRSLDAKLYRDGMNTPEIRQFMARLIIFMDFTIAIAIPLAFFDQHLLWFALGLTLAVHNFKSLCSFVHSALGQKYNRRLVIKQFFIFNLRMLITAIVLFVSIVWLSAIIWALILGLSSVIGMLAFWFFLRYRKQEFVSKKLHPSKQEA